MSSLQIITLLITRDEVELEVEVTGLFCKGERMTLESPMVPGSVEFESACLDGKPFELTAEEIKKAEEKIFEYVYENTSPEMRRRWVV